MSELGPEYNDEEAKKLGDQAELQKALDMADIQELIRELEVTKAQIMESLNEVKDLVDETHWKQLQEAAQKAVEPIDNQIEGLRKRLQPPTQ